jgi:hypothetical protein
MKPLTVVKRSVKRTIEAGEFPNGIPEPNTIMIDYDRGCAEYIPSRARYPFLDAWVIPMELAEQIDVLVNGKQETPPRSIEEGGLPAVNCTDDKCKL